MIATAAAPALLRLSDAAAVLTLAAIAAALLLPARYVAVPDHLRPGAWSQDTISAPAAIALLAVNWRLRQGWGKGWLITAGLFGLLVVLFATLWLVQLLPAIAARQPLLGQTTFVLDLAFALPLTALTAWLL